MRLRKTLICAALMLLWGCALASAPYCVPLPEGDALITADGVFVVEPGVYEDIITVEPGMLYLAGEPGSYAIIDHRGQEIAAAQVSMARYAQDVIVFRENGLYGAMRADGEIIVQPEWTQLAANGNGGFLALNDTPFDNAGDEVFYIDASGEVVSTGNRVVGTLREISGNRLPFMVSDGTYGIMDEKGQVVKPAGWLYVSAFSQGAAVVSDENGMGLVDDRGEVILECGYALIQRSEEIVAALSGDGLLEVYAGDGRTLLYTVDASGASVSVAGGYAAVTDENGSALYGRDGRCIYRGSPKASYAVGLNRQIIVSDGEWGSECVWLMNPGGGAASEKYQRILPLSGNRYAFMTMNGATYFSEALDGLQRAWDYESVRYGMIDGAGNEILPAQYTEILPEEDDRFILLCEDGAYLSDESGGIIKSWFRPE